MLDALREAQTAGENGEIPVGAVIVREGKIIAVGRNRREEKQNALSHAEIEAIDAACRITSSWRLDGCDMYVTLEPCPMCAGAIINARIRTVVYGACDLRCGGIDSVINRRDYPYNHRPEIYAGICEEECQQMLNKFFAGLRRKSDEE